MQLVNVAAKDVQPGDELYNGGKGAPCFWWVRVRSVTPRDANTVVIETVYWDTWKHPREGVCVRRA